MIGPLICSGAVALTVISVNGASWSYAFSQSNPQTNQFEQRLNASIAEAADRLAADVVRLVDAKRYDEGVKKLASAICNSQKPDLQRDALR